MRSLDNDKVVRIIANETHINVLEIKDNKAILNDSEYVVADFVKEV